MDKQKLWEIHVCQTGAVHVHYESSSARVLRDGFSGLARERRDVADQLEDLELVKSQTTKRRCHE